LTPTSANISGVSTSYDGGKTWQPDDAGRQDKVVIDSIFRTWNDRPRVQAFGTSIIQVVKTSFVLILTAFSDHQTREKHGNYYFLL
jgi:hypothetical protein